MSPSVFWTLVRKDLYLMRGFIILTVAVGLGSLVLVAFGGVAFAVGGILFLTVNVGSGIFIAMFTYIAERKENTRLFALSLPISGQQLDLAKLVAAFITYLIPWLTLTLAALLLFLLPPAVTKGMIVYVLMLQCFVIALFSTVLATMAVVRSEPAVGVVIIASNIAFSLFMVTLNLPRVSAPLHGPYIVWTEISVWMLAGDAAVFLVGLVFSLSMITRNRDHL